MHLLANCLLNQGCLTGIIVSRELPALTSRLGGAYYGRSAQLFCWN